MPPHKRSFITLNPFQGLSDDLTSINESDDDQKSPNQNITEPTNASEQIPELDMNGNTWTTALDPRTVKKHKLARNRLFQRQKNAFRFMDLPFEIREEIYRKLLVRPVGIRPCEVILRRKIKGRPSYLFNKEEQTYRYAYHANYWDEYREYKYQYEGFVQEKSRHIIPSYDGSFQERFGFSGFFGVGMLRTCKLICMEASKIFYAENRWVFAPTHSLRLKVLNEDEWYLRQGESQPVHLLPGTLNKNGSEKSDPQNERAVARLFNQTKGLCQPSFVLRDSLSKFLRKIGPRNAALVRRIVLEGGFQEHQNRGGIRLGIGSILPIYAVILDVVFGGLQEIEMVRTDQDFRSVDLSDIRIEDIMTNFVKGVPRVDRLVLGSFVELTQNEENELGGNEAYLRRRRLDDWGIVRHLTELVRDRSDVRARAGWKIMEIQANQMNRAAMAKVLKAKIQAEVEELRKLAI